MSTHKQFVVRYSTEYFTNSCWGVYATMEQAAEEAMGLKQRFLSVQMHREAMHVTTIHHGNVTLIICTP